MTFLELCKRFRQEAGISGTGPSTVSGQTGELKHVVDWVSNAWDDIKIRHENWSFLRDEFSFSTVSGQRSYTTSQAGITDFAKWDLEHTKIYSSSVADEYLLTYVSYDDFRKTYMMGQAATGKPAYYTIAPDKSMIVYPTPDDAYTIYGDYYKAGATLTDDDDEPDMPARFHMLIVYKALEAYGMYEAAQDALTRGNKEAMRIMMHLERDQLPDIMEPDGWMT